MITCKEAVDRLWAHLDRSPGEVVDRELEAHLGVCRHCCGELDFATQVRELMRRQGTSYEVGPETRARLEALLKDLGETK